jgi:hypothetical protein
MTFSPHISRIIARGDAALFESALCISITDNRKTARAFLRYCGKLSPGEAGLSERIVKGARLIEKTAFVFKAAFLLDVSCSAAPFWL